MTTGWLDRWRRSGDVLAGLTLGLVVMADWLFYEQPIGWTLGLYLLLLILMVSVRGPRLWAGRIGPIVAALLLGLAVALAWQPDPLAVALSLVGLVILALGMRDGWTRSVNTWAKRLLLVIPLSLVQPVLDLVTRNRWCRRRRHPLTRLPFIGRWILPVALSLVFVGLFWLANPVIGSWMGRLGDWLGDWASRWSDLFAPQRVLLWAAVACGVWSLMRVRVRSVQTQQPLAAPVDVTFLNRLTSVPTVLRCLVLFNAVFLAQTALDLTYLWGGAALPDGMTYAEYAHRGAYPLVATALLAGGFVLWTFRAGGAAEQSAWARRLVYLWLVQNLLLLVSAAWRLRLYVDAYSLTYWRVAAGIWMLLVALGLVWIIARLATARSNRWLLGANLATAGVVLYACCFVNFAGGIAWFNVRRCAEVGGPGTPIDLAYLESLGPEALPALHWLDQQTRDRNAPAHVATTADRLRARLDEQLSDWRGWTWRRAALAQVIPPTQRVAAARREGDADAGRIAARATSP